MTDVPVTLDRKHADRAVSTAATATVVAYAVLGAALLVTRLAYLGHSFWHDELFAVSEYVRRGPHAILAGAGLSHELFSLLEWATRPVAGDSEVAFRLWSAIPFLLGVIVVAVWLHHRIGALSGILFLYLATVSPLLLDITRQARGYGLAFLAMAVMTVAGLEARRGGTGWAVATFCVSGVLGAWTLPQFAIAFVATGAVLLGEQALRRRLAVGLAVSLVSIAAFYAPHLGQVQAASRIEDGVQIHGAWVVTASLDQIVVPALIWIDGTALVAGIVWLPLLLVAAALIGSSPLAHDRRALLLLGSGVVATVFVLWVGRAYVIPRYLSFLLVPSFMLLASGMAAVLGHREGRPALFRAVASLVVLGVLGVRFVTLAPDVVRLPREAHRDAARAVTSETPAGTPVLAYLHNPGDLAYYLGRPVHVLRGASVVTRVCSAGMTVAYVTQPFAIRSVDVPCLSRPGVKHYRFRQYTRGEMNVWIVPPSG